MMHGDSLTLEGWPHGVKIKASQEEIWLIFNNYTNSLIYWSYLLPTGEKYTEEEGEGGGNDSQDTGLISIISFKIVEWLV